MNVLLRHRRNRVAAAGLVLFAGLGAASIRAAQRPDPARLSSAREPDPIREAIDSGPFYENGLKILDPYISALERNTGSATSGELLLALEVRGALRYHVADLMGASQDFGRLVRLNPEWEPSSRAFSPTIREFYGTVLNATLARVRIALTPPDAAITLDGRPVPDLNRILVVPGTPHTLVASRAGHETVTKPFETTAGQQLELSLTLKRIMASLTLVSNPPGAQVYVKDASNDSYRLLAVTAVQPGAPSGTSDRSEGAIKVDIKPGAYTLQFRLPCYRTVEFRTPIDNAIDYGLKPVVLESASGTVVVDSAVKDSTVELDGQAKGSSPLTIANVCEGKHILEIATPYGRDRREIDVTRGATVRVRPELKPNVAILIADDDPFATALERDLLRAFSGVRSITFVPAARDRLRDPRSTIVTELLRRSGTDRSERTAFYSDALRVQGLAVIARSALRDDWLRMDLHIAWGSAPDTIDFGLNDAPSIQRAVARIDNLPAMLGLSADVTTIDVIGVNGPVIAAVDRSAAARGIQKGDTVVAVEGTPVANTADFEVAVRARLPSASIRIELQGQDGQRRTQTAVAQPVVRAFSVTDRTLAFNVVAMVLATRTRPDVTPLERSAIKLNRGIALLHAGDFRTAAAELKESALPSGGGISQGTVDYLLGLCYFGLGLNGEAEAAWKRTEQHPGSMLTDDGPLIADLIHQNQVSPRR